MPATLNYVKDGVPQRLDCGPIVAVGRSSSNDIVLPDHKVSRSHAILRCLANSQYYIIDVGSANGTFMNGGRVIVPTALNDGDEIAIGRTTFVFHQECENVPKDGYEEEESVTITATVMPTIRQVAVLVADIRDYTVLSERIPIEVLARLLSHWFRSANDIVEENRGLVDKFIGDAVMARWVVSDEDIDRVVLRSLRTAYELNRMTERLSGDFPGLPQPLRIGVGINIGEAAVDVRGSGRFQDYTILGDSVNLAFRLESASKELKTDIVMSDDAFKCLPPGFYEEHQCSIRLKGKDDPVLVSKLTFAELRHVLDKQTSVDRR